MADRTGIEWTDATWNPMRGCSRVSEGCRNCYAEIVAARFSQPGQPFHGFAERDRHGSKWTGRVELVHTLLDLPLRWLKPRRIFVNSMSDIFHESLDIEELASIFAVMLAAHRLRGHTFQVLTKRAASMHRVLTQPRFWEEASREANDCLAKYCCGVAGLRHLFAGYSDPTPDSPPPGIWLGVSVEHQVAADQRVPLLLATPATVRFLSCEPLLGPVGLRVIRWISDRGFVNALTEATQHPETRARDPDRFPDTNRIDWVICGGETGPGARPMHPDWARSLRDQCAAAGVAFFFKQWGKWAPDAIAGPFLKFAADPGEETHRWPYDEATDCWRIGKKRAGATLDGREWREMPA